MERTYEELRQFIHAFYDAYLIAGDLKLVESFLDDDIQWVGAGINEMGLGKENTLKIIKDKMDEGSMPVSYRLCPLNCQELDKSCYKLFYELELVFENLQHVNYPVKLRIMTVCRFNADGLKITSHHESVPLAVRKKEGLFGDNVIKAYNRRIKNRYSDLLSKSIPGGVMGGYLEKGRPFYYINDRMLDYLGYTYEEFLASIDGYIINCLHPQDRERVEREVTQAFNANQEYEVQYRMLKKDGSYIWVNDIGKKSLSENGREVCLSVIRDISTEVEANQQLKAEIAGKEKQAKRYDHLFQSVLCGIVQYTLDKDGNVVFKDANKEAIRIFGYTEEEFWAKNDWFLPDLIDERDHDLMLGSLKKSLSLGDAKTYEYRLKQKNGDPCWIIGSAEIIRDIDGEIIVQSVFLDIDKSKKTELRNQRLNEQVRAGNELLMLALEHTSMCEFYYYPQDRVVSVPKRTCKIYECRSKYEDMPYSFAQEYVDEISYNQYYDMYARINRGEKTAKSEFKSKNGQWCRQTLSTVGFDESGRPTYVVGIVEDITKEKEMSCALEEARSLDRLTGLYSKEAGVAKVRDYLQQKSLDEICAIMLLDMDNFKQLCATEGQVFANAVLQDVAAILRDETGPNDILIRLGGDEFMLFVKNCDTVHARALGSRITERTRTLYGKEHKTAGISVSIGFCVSNSVGEYSGMYRCAESALLYVKEHNKGGYACYLDISIEVGTALTQIYTNQHLFNDIDDNSNFSSENMMDFALDLLGKAKNLDDAIFLLLSRIGNKYGFDRVSIIEVNPEYLSYRFTYQWAREKHDILIGQDFYLSAQDFDAIPKLYNDDGISVNSYVNGYIEERMFPSCLKAAMWNQGVYAGALIFERNSMGFEWTDEMKKLILEMTKLISSFIMKARADAVSQAKSDFLSRMSHEIRTPMNAISGMTTIAKSSLDNRVKLVDCLNKIESANDYLLTLINDILDMSRIESGKIELNYESARLSYSMEKLAALMGPQASNKNITLAFVNGYEADRPLRMDVLRLNQVLINIIGNAIKFTEPGGIVTVKAEPVSNADGLKLRFSVIDTGCGIEKPAISRIFNVFEQGGKDTASQYGGTGLGLTISSKLVQMMGGTLEVASEPGKGSNFYFILPFEFGEETSPANESGASKPRLTSFAGKRVLLAEDNTLNREIAVAILAMQGFAVEEAENGKEALEMFEKHKSGYYDAILMDIRMPVMDGLEATKKIRTLQKKDSRTIPIIAMTANAFDEDTKKSMESGMNGHLTKPIVVEKLMDLLSSCLA